VLVGSAQNRFPLGGRISSKLPGIRCSNTVSGDFDDLSALAATPIFRWPKCGLALTGICRVARSKSRR
jgi:hypothetical protein